jgi:predicted Zn-dependent protease
VGFLSRRTIHLIEFGTVSAPQADELDLRLLRFRKSPNTAEGLTLADALVAASRERDALSVYDLLRKGAPRDASLTHRAAKVLLALGDLPASQRALLEALQVAPDDAGIAATLGEVLLKRGEPGRAKELLARHRGDATIDKLYSRAERLARLSADIDEPIPAIEDRTTVPTVPPEARKTTPPESLPKRGAAPTGPTEDDAEGFFEDVPTAMIDRSQLEALKSARTSVPEDGASTKPPPVPPPAPGPSFEVAVDADDTREIVTADMIPMPEPETRSWAGGVLEEEPPEDAIVEDDAASSPVVARRQKAGARGIKVVALLAVVVAVAGGGWLVRDRLLAADPARAHELRADADRIFRDGEPSRFEEAIVKLEEAREIAPAEGFEESVEAFGRALALLELESGDLARARAAAERVEGPLRDVVIEAVNFVSTREPPALSSLPLPSKVLEPRASHLLGRLRQAAGGDPLVDFELAERDDASGVPAARTERALVLLSRGEREAATAVLDEGDGHGARLAMARLLARPEGTAPEELAATSPAPFDRLLGALVRAELHIARGRSSDARAELANLEPTLIRGPLAPLLMARVAHRAGDLELARRLVAKANERSGDEHSRVFMAELSLEAGDTSRTRELLAELTGEGALSLALRLARLTGRAEDATRAREILGDLQLSEVDATAHRIALALAEGAPDAVVDGLVASLEGSDDGTALLARAEVAFARGEYGRALELAARGAEQLHDSLAASRIIGVSALVLGDAERARPALERASGAGDAVARARLAELALAEGRAEDALKLVSATTVDLLPPDARAAAVRTRALALAESGEPDAAREALRALGDVEDEATRAVRAKIGVPEDSAVTLESLASKAEPLLKKDRGTAADAPLLTAYATALEASGDTKRAASAYQLAVRLEPTSIEARLGYARALIRGRKERQALRVLERADAVLIERGERTFPTELLLLRGRALLEQGKRGDAVASLLEASARADAPAETHFFLAEALAGRKTADSRAAYERYLELEPQGPHAKRAERAIQR